MLFRFEGLRREIGVIRCWRKKNVLFIGVIVLEEYSF